MISGDASPQFKEIFMKTNKTQGVLVLYDSLRVSGQLKKADALQELDISSLTFKRYISELRCYFANFDPYNEVIYDRSHDTYYLVKAIENITR